MRGPLRSVANFCESETQMNHLSWTLRFHSVIAQASGLIWVKWHSPKIEALITLVVENITFLRALYLLHPFSFVGSCESRPAPTVLQHPTVLSHRVFSVPCLHFAFYSKTLTSPYSPLFSRSCSWGENQLCLTLLPNWVFSIFGDFSNLHVWRWWFDILFEF